MTRPPGYGIIYNWDGSPYGYSEVPQSVDQLLEKVYAPLRDTQVGRPVLVHGHSRRHLAQRRPGARRRLPRSQVSHGRGVRRR